MIRFEEEKEVCIPNFNGGNGITRAYMFIDENAKIMKAILEKGCSIGEHTHETSSEMIYVISGEAKFSINGNEEIVKAGECHYCPKGSRHSVVNEKEEDLVMFCVVPNQ